MVGRSETEGGFRATFQPLAPPAPRGVTGGLRGLPGNPCTITVRPGPEGQRRFVVERDQSAGRRRVEEDTRRSASHAGPVGEVASGGEAVSASEVVPEVTDASTTTAENVTRGRPTAPSRTGRPCASRTAGRSCRPDPRAARRPGVAGRRSETRTGTAVASDSWADARSRRSRREGEYGPARQHFLPPTAHSGPLWDTRFGSP